MFEFDELVSAGFGATWNFQNMPTIALRGNSGFKALDDGKLGKCASMDVSLLGANISGLITDGSNG